MESPVRRRRPRSVAPITTTRSPVAGGRWSRPTVALHTAERDVARMHLVAARVVDDEDGVLIRSVCRCGQRR